MKPLIILPPEVMSPEDIKELRDNGFCVVTAKDPAAVKFVDAIPAVTSRTQIEHAAIQLSRKILNGDIFRDNRRDFALMFVDIITNGTALDIKPTQAEVEKIEYDNAKIEEIRRQAREDAKAERAALKAKQKTV